jgi:hypothetical protein
VCSLVAGETTCPQSCSLATGVVLSPVYTAVTWQQVYISQYDGTKRALPWIWLNTEDCYSACEPTQSMRRPVTRAACVFPRCRSASESPAEALFNYAPSRSDCIVPNSRIGD